MSTRLLLVVFSGNATVFALGTLGGVFNGNTGVVLSGTAGFLLCVAVLLWEARPVKRSLKPGFKD